MWSRIASFLIRHRLPAVVGLFVITLLMAVPIPELGMQYKYGGILPEDDPAELAHARFLESFGAEGNVLIIGVEDARLRTAEGNVVFALVRPRASSRRGRVGGDGDEKEEEARMRGAWHGACASTGLRACVLKV